ncbi:uncharacterized protein LOC131939920, partial [Physella acuta]|uniref:uncharacterized protein LOC131939920 n=1 Tax=Physella acuta TaxID=109671 RepID=UPI0027DAFF2A
TKCDDPPKLVLGEWKEPCNPLVGSICKLLCPDNYLVKGEMFIVCRESHHNSNNWSTPGVCQFNASNKTSTKDVSENIILETGTNHSLNECQFGWFGHRCMYRDLTLIANGVFPPEILINGKCVEDTFIVVYFRKAVYFESIIMTFYKVIPSSRIYKFVSNKTTAGECREIFEYPQNTYTLALECQLVEPVNQITVYFKQPAQICEFNINGGRPQLFFSNSLSISIFDW